MRKTIFCLALIIVATLYALAVYAWFAEGNINMEKQRRNEISEDLIRYLPIE